MYAIALGICAVLVSWLTREWQFPSPHWAVLSCMVTMQSLKDEGQLRNIIVISVERVIGALIGIAFGYWGLVYMQIFVTDLMRSIYYVILFLVVALAGQVSSLHNGFKLAPVAATLMISLMVMSHDPLSVINTYAVSLITGVIIGAGMSVLYRLAEENRRKRSRIKK